MIHFWYSTSLPPEVSRALSNILRYRADCTLLFFCAKKRGSNWIFFLIKIFSNISIEKKLKDEWLCRNPKVVNEKNVPI